MKDQIILSEEIKKYIPVKKRGDLAWAKCPFHGEKTPSFVINDEKKFFYCFGCGIHGDVFTFHQKYFNKSFNETVQELGAAYGIRVNFKHIKNIQNNESIEKILELSKDFYKLKLKESPEVLDYIQKRKISEEIIEKFEIGYAKGSELIDYLIHKGFSIDEIKKSGVNSYGGLDRFRNRIIFPIISKNKKIIGFAGRVLDNSEPKYLNSPETDIFQKNFHLFNENNLEPNLPIILVEGYMDVVSLTQYGLKNVVAAMGTSLSQGQVLSIFRNSNILYLMFDGDSAGQAAVERNLEVCLKLLNSESQIFICSMPTDQDPDNLAKNSDKKILESVINNSQNLLDWKWGQIIKIFKKSPNSLAKIFENIEFFLQNLKEKNLRRAYKTFFDDKISDFKKNFKTIQTPLEAINSEDIVIMIILKTPEFLNIVIEDLMSCSFTNKIYEKIRQDMLEKITVEMWETEQTISFILQKYEKNVKNLINNKHFSYIILNRDFALQYLMDTLCILKRSSIDSSE